MKTSLNGTTHHLFLTMKGLRFLLLVALAMFVNTTQSVIIAAVITQHPTNTEIRVRPDPGEDVAPATNATFTVAATTLNPPLTYQWRVNGTNLLASDHYPGITTPMLTVSNVTIADYGDYQCAVMDLAGTNLSTYATLYPLVRPTYLIPPLSQTVPAFSAVTVSVVLSNGFPPPFYWTWYRGTNPNPSSGNFFGNKIIGDSKTNFYTIPGGIVSNDSSVYTLRLTNRAQSAQTDVRNPAYWASFTITTIADTDLDGMPDSYELAYSGSTTGFAPGLDADGDGMSNLAEYQAGTDPTNSASYLRIEHSIVPGTATLWFAAASNHTYAIQFTDSVPYPAAFWSTLANFVAVPTNRVEVATDPLWTTNRFYRLVTPRQP